jgi:hypothetical protein
MYHSLLHCNCEPFVLCHSERSEESSIAQDKLRVVISTFLPTTEILQSLPSFRMTGEGTEIDTSLTLLAMTQL